MSDIVNFDFDVNFPNRTIDFSYKNRSLFEWVYFFINKVENSTLYTTENYSKSYLEKLKSFGCVIPKISNDREGISPWWGNFDEYERKEKFISKINILKTLNGTNLIPDFVTDVRSQEKLDRVLKNQGSYFFREEYNFSGIGSCIYESGKFYNFKKGVIAPLLNVKQTFGVTVDLDNDTYFICTNTIGANGTFRGGHLVGVNSFSKYLNSREDSIKEEFKDIFAKLRACGAKGVIQFDSLIYDVDGKSHWYKIVEVNYRKTMGLLIKSLTEMFGEGEFVISTKPINGIQISPDNLKLKSYYIPKV
ncbi:hypothetical protein [Bacteriovorax sp. Seq25_V]|uniref:hypothetical protein n=1 Tax=Bacteriovorax sp. Seq25_V TaxID=1201288 RepID=UPI00038A07EE|nr:hypothetical protein [Bacteriovorax sp. Seq25_V]EQC47128.1 hypothetical protein M900_0555 [Bacteriovorax sp. Seq25_V]